MARVFISYRRSEAKWAAGRLYDRLAEVIGRDNLFFDVSNIEPGEDFVARITQIVEKCDVLLAVIGPTWATATDSAGRRRLERTNDLVRIELRAALERNIRVIPMLLDGAVMPDEGQLPDDIAGLARRNAHDVSFAHFHADLDSFVRVLQRILAGPPGKVAPEAPAVKPPPPSPPPPPKVEKMPFSLSLETLGGVATPLISRGAPLPAEAKDIFSTAADNQKSVEVRVLAGERLTSKDNVSVGVFALDGLPDAPKGEPKIEIKAVVDTALILTITAEDQATHRKQVLDAVDLTRITLPDGARKEELAAFTPPSSPRDSQLNDLSGLFDSLFGAPSEAKGNPRLDRVQEILVTAQNAARGTKQEVTLTDGTKVTVKIPPGVETGGRLRLKGLGGKPAGGGSRGDLFLNVRVVP